MNDYNLAIALLARMMGGLGLVQNEGATGTPDLSASDFEQPNPSSVATTLDVNDGHRYRVTVEVVS